MISTKLTKVILVGVVALTANASLADVNHYIEGQINISNPRDVDTKALTGTVSGITYTGVKADFEFDSDTTLGVEFGVSNLYNSNFRVGFSYTKPRIKLDKATLSGEISSGGVTLTGPVSVTPADFATVGLSFDNDVRLYMINTYYDFDEIASIKPFVGIGIGMADIENAKDNKLTLAAIVGAKHYFNEKVYLGGKLNYSHIKGPKDKLGLDYEDISFYTGSLVVGYEF